MVLGDDQHGGWIKPGTTIAAALGEGEFHVCLAPRPQQAAGERVGRCIRAFPSEQRAGPEAAEGRRGRRGSPRGGEGRESTPQRALQAVDRRGTAEQRRTNDRSCPVVGEAAGNSVIGSRPATA
jgi:hypothetical protein